MESTNKEIISDPILEQKKLTESTNFDNIEYLTSGKLFFNNKTEFTGYDIADKYFIEFRQLLYPRLLLTDDLKEETTQAFEIESCLISSFVYESDMIEPLLNKFKVKSLIVKDKLGDNTSSKVKINEFITYIHPPIEFTLKWGKFHSKLILFKFKKSLRVIVSSANMTNLDWYYLGQVIWFQDFPLIEPKKETEVKQKTEFQEYLEAYVLSPYLSSSKLKLSDININLDDYDFSKSAAYLVSTISGRFKNNINKYGMLRIKDIIDNNLKLSNMTRIEIQCSSFGNLKYKWTSQVLNCFGIECQSKDKLNNKKIKDEDYCFDKLSFYFPTKTYINSIKNGPEIANCLFLNQQNYNLFIKNFKIMKTLNKSKSIEQVYHSKIIVVSKDITTDDLEVTKEEIYYLGSHNFSPSAWGNLELKDTQLSSGNYELGVILNSSIMNKQEKNKIREAYLFSKDVETIENAKEKPWLLN